MIKRFCDWCGGEIRWNQSYTDISIKEPKTHIRTYDVCETCTQGLNIYIKSVRK